MTTLSKSRQPSVFGNALRGGYAPKKTHFVPSVQLNVLRDLRLFERAVQDRKRHFAATKMATPHNLRHVATNELIAATVSHHLQKPLRSSSEFLRSPRREDRTVSLQDSIRSFFRRVENSEYAPFWDKIRSFSLLQKDWDTYGTGPISLDSRLGARAVLRAIESNRLPMLFLTATSDESILLKHRAKLSTLTWEIDDDGEIGVMIEKEGSRLELQSMRADEVSRFVANLK